MNCVHLIRALFLNTLHCLNLISCSKQTKAIWMSACIWYDIYIYIYFKEYDEREWHTSTIIIHWFGRLLARSLGVVDSVLYFVKLPVNWTVYIGIVEQRFNRYNRGFIECRLSWLNCSSRNANAKRLLEFLFFALFIIVEYWTAICGRQIFQIIFFFLLLLPEIETRFIVSVRPDRVQTQIIEEQWQQQQY